MAENRGYGDHSDPIKSLYYHVFRSDYVSSLVENALSGGGGRVRSDVLLITLDYFDKCDLKNVTSQCCGYHLLQAIVAVVGLVQSRTSCAVMWTTSGDNHRGSHLLQTIIFYCVQTASHPEIWLFVFLPIRACLSRGVAGHGIASSLF